MDRRIPSNADTTEALRALRERYRATISNTVAAFRRLSAQLASNPTAPEVVEALRRELHRIHGTAGSYGFTDASRLAAELEAAAIRWTADATLDLARRAAMTADFATSLELSVGGATDTSSSETQRAVAAPPLGTTSPPAVELPKPAAIVGSSAELIIVEDDEPLVEMLSYAFRTAGYSFLRYSSGPEALEALLALEVGNTRPVLFLDIDLPGLDGFSLHERLRVERPSAFTTVFLTARAGEAEQLRAYRLGAIDYVSKPVNLRILLAKIPSWLDRERRSA